jgi:hypothetical protein
MGASLIQPCRVKDEGPLGRKLLLYGKKPLDALRVDGTVRIRVG